MSKLKTSSVSPSQVNTHILAKHHLLDRDGPDVRSVTNDLVGLHATSNVTPYVSLFNRIEEFTPDDLNREMYENGGLLRIRAMRGTFFLFTRGLITTVVKATEFSPQRITKSLEHGGVSPQEFQTMSEIILNQLSRGPKTLPEIKRDMSPGHSRIVNWKRGWRITRRTNLGLVLQLLLLQRKVQSQPERLEWSRIDWDGYGTRTFTRISKVTYSLSSTPTSVGTTLEKAKLKLAELYLKRYGPITVDDIAWWMNESKRHVLNLLEGLRDKLTKIRIAGHKAEFLLHDDDLTVLERTPEKKDCVRFLPYEDPYAKSRKLRELIIPKASERQAYLSGNALPTVISNGKIVGTWSIRANSETATVNVKLFTPTKRTTTDRIVEEGSRLGAFLIGEKPVTVSLTR